MYHKLLTLSLLSLTFALLPLMSRSQEKEHVVLIETNMGNLKAKLYNDTPLHRDNFIRLAKSGHYNGTLFYRVVKNFVIQGGSSDSRNAIDQTYPNANTYFNSPLRSDGSQKWVDFVYTYWHVDCVRKMSLNSFVKHYQNWCKQKKYIFNKSKAEEIYTKATELVPVFPKNEITKRIIRQAIAQLNSTSATVETIRILMNETASKLPEYPIVMQFKGIGPSLGPQLMAEIGDITRFTHKGALTAFAGVDPGVNESGSYAQKSVRTSKRGSSNLRETLLQVMDVLIKTMPQDDPVYQFMDRKRAQGKPYYVYMTAGANKFLRIYYGRVKEYLCILSESS